MERMPDTVMKKGSYAREDGVRQQVQGVEVDRGAGRRCREKGWVDVTSDRQAWPDCTETRKH